MEEIRRFFRTYEMQLLLTLADFRPKRQKRASGTEVRKGTESKTSVPQVLISEKKDLKGAKVITVKGKNRKAYTVKDLRKGKRYYIAVRPYKTKGGKRYIGIRSRIKAIKVR